MAIINININIYIYIYIKAETSCESMRFYHVVHSMKRIEIFLNHIRDKNKFKIRTLYFLWFNVSRLLFVTFFIQCFKITISFIWFIVLRFFLSLTHKKLFAFLFTLFTSTLLYTHAHKNPSCHFISNTLKQKWCHLPSAF